jgi:hydroxymethylpyrimidine pyrophosphatase-like HAD family hydrolase
MRFFALACDYDGTLARNGHVDEPTLGAVKRLLASRRKLVLVTGRELPELQKTFPHLDLFDRVVAENGALLFTPSSGEEKPLAERPPQAFINELLHRNVHPLAVGRVIVATWSPNEHAILDVIRDLGLELQVIFNKGAIMVLPSGVNKATGLAAALDAMNLAPEQVAGIGDAENDHAFLKICGCSVAVANALPMLKAEVCFVTRGDHGAGVSELIDELIADDLGQRACCARRPRATVETTASS